MIEDETVGWHHQLNGYEFEKTPRDSEGQGGRACRSPWGLQRVRHDLASEQKISDERPHRGELQDFATLYWSFLVLQEHFFRPPRFRGSRIPCLTESSIK